MRVISEMSCTINHRRSQRLEAAQKSKIDHHSEMRFLRWRLRSMKKVFQDQKRIMISIKNTFVYKKYQKVYRAHRNKKWRYEKSLLKEIKARYKREQSMINIQRQLKELSLVDEKTIKTAAYVFIERVRIIDILFVFIASSLKEECKRRVKAINVLTALCNLQKDHHFRCRNSFFMNIKLEWNLTSSSLSDFISIECKLTQCIFCLDCEELSTKTRLKFFYSHDDLKKHFYRKHLHHHLNSKIDHMFSFKMQSYLEKQNAFAESCRTDAQDINLIITHYHRSCISNFFKDYHTFFNHSILSRASIQYSTWLISYLSAIINALYCFVLLNSTILIYIDVRLSISSVFIYDVSLSFLVLKNIIYNSTEKNYNYSSFLCVFVCAIEDFLVTICSFYIIAVLKIDFNYINDISNFTVLWYKMCTVAFLMNRCLYWKCFTSWVMSCIHFNVVSSLYSVEFRVIKVSLFTSLIWFLYHRDFERVKSPSK